MSRKEASQIQCELRKRIRLRKRLPAIRKVAGGDVGYLGGKAVSAVVVMEFPGLETLEKKFFVSEVAFPYIPGLLSFREGPALLGALALVECEPDVILFDGQGIAHPRRMGIATHLGLLLEKPTIGCAKSLLIGEYLPPREEKGSHSLLKDKGEVIGAAVRTGRERKPVFVSPGDGIDLRASIQIVLQCTEQHRLPEPLRQAHLLANEIKEGLRGAIKRHL